jgi:hypothetical protein
MNMTAAAINTRSRKKQNNGCLRGCGCIVIILIAVLVLGGVYIYSAYVYTSEEAEEIKTMSHEICSYSLPKEFKPEGAIDLFFARAAMFSNNEKDPFRIARAAIIEYDSGDQNDLMMQQFRDRVLPAVLKKVTITSSQTNTLVSVTSPAGTQISRRQLVINIKETENPLRIYEGFFVHKGKLIHGMIGSFDPEMNAISLDFINSLSPPESKE